MREFTEKYNLHTHSFYCGHGSGTIDQYVEEARSGGLSLLGFSEHCPFPDNFLHRSRMDYNRMADYEADVRKYMGSGNPVVLLGYECDFFDRYRDYLAGLKESGRVDYLVTGTHFIVRKDKSRVSPFSDTLEKDDLKRYRDQMVAAIESGLFDFVAHPDLFMAGYADWDGTCEEIATDIIKAAIGHSLPLEINGNGMLKKPVGERWAYPHRAFTLLASSLGASSILSTDAHSVENLLKTKADLEDFAHQCGSHLVKPSVTDGHLGWRRL